MVAVFAGVAIAAVRAGGPALASTDRPAVGLAGIAIETCRRQRAAATWTTFSAHARRRVPAAGRDRSRSPKVHFIRPRVTRNRSLVPRLPGLRRLRVPHPVVTRRAFTSDQIGAHDAHVRALYDRERHA